MACCLTAPSHYLNPCWLVISEVQWPSPEGSFRRYFSHQPLQSAWIWLSRYLKFHSNIPRVNKLMPHCDNPKWWELQNKFKTLLNLYQQNNIDILVFQVDTLRPRRNRRLFANNIFKCILLNENILISIKISLKFIPKGTINNIPALVQIMAWHQPGDKPYASLGLNELTNELSLKNHSFNDEVGHHCYRYWVVTCMISAIT